MPTLDSGEVGGDFEPGELTRILGLFHAQNCSRNTVKWERRALILEDCTPIFHLLRCVAVIPDDRL